MRKLFGCLYFPASGPLLGPWTLPWPPGPVPSPGPRFVFTGPSPQFVFTGSGPQFVFFGPGLQLYYQSGARVCIYQSCLLNLYLYLRHWYTICITGLEPEYAFTLLLVVVIVVVVISLEWIIPILVCRF